MFTTTVVEGGQFRPGYYKAVTRGYGTQALLLDRRSTESGEGIWVEEGVYPNHPTIDGRVFVSMRFPPSVLAVEDFRAVQREGLPYGGWLQLAATDPDLDGGEAFQDGLRRLQRAALGPSRPTLTPA